MYVHTSLLLVRHININMNIHTYTTSSTNILPLVCQEELSRAQISLIIYLDSKVIRARVRCKCRFPLVRCGCLAATILASERSGSALRDHCARDAHPIHGGTHDSPRIPSALTGGVEPEELPVRLASVAMTHDLDGC